MQRQQRVGRPAVFRGYLCAALVAQLRKSTAQRRAGNPNQSRVRREQLQDQQDGGGDGERGYQQAGEHGRIGRGKQAEADEDGGKPENQDDQ